MLLNSQLTLSDSDSTQMSSAKVTITGGYTEGDTLSIQGTITNVFATYTQNTIGPKSELSFTTSGNTTISDLQDALRKVTFSSSSANPTAISATRTISWQVTDQDNTSPATSTVVTSTVTITPVNNVPTLSAFPSPMGWKTAISQSLIAI